MLPGFTVCDDALTVAGSDATTQLFSLKPTRKLYVPQIEVTFRGVTTAGQEPRVRIHRGSFTLSGGTTITPVPLDTSSDPATSTTVCRSVPTVGVAATDSNRIATGTYQGGVARVFVSPLVVHADEELLVIVDNGATALTADYFCYFVETI